MLARTASNLFWLTRYMERADYVARLLEVAGRMNAVRVDADDESEWESAIYASGDQTAYFARHERASRRQVVDFLATDADNPSSIVSCVETARENARAVRTALTTDMWETVNGLWLELPRFQRQQMTTARLIELVDWVKDRVSRFHGVAATAMVRADGYHFTRLGQFLERADNTARLLDVKYHVRLPSVADVGGVVDYYQWLAILRTVDARRAYRALYHGHVQAGQVAELLISRQEFPRSLAYCYQMITRHLDAIERRDERLTAEARRRAHILYSSLRFARVDKIVASGLHEYLTDVINRTAALGEKIAEGHLF